VVTDFCQLDDLKLVENAKPTQVTLGGLAFVHSGLHLGVVLVRLVCALFAVGLVLSGCKTGEDLVLPNQSLGFDVEVPGEPGVAAGTDFDDCADAFVVDAGDAIHL